MQIKQDNFGGIAPKVSPNLLPDKMAVTAENLRIDSGAIIPIANVTNVASVASTRRSLYRYTDADGTKTWLSWDAEGVNVVRSPVPNDSYGRIYYTGDTEPKYNFASNIAGSVAGLLLGIPRPLYAPILSSSGVTTDQVLGGKVFTANAVAAGNPSGTLTLTGGATVTTPSTVTAGSFVVGRRYTIQSVGTTDFTLIGATANTVGVEFTATDVGSGTGTAIASDGLTRTTTGGKWAVQGYSTEYYKDACALRFSIPTRTYGAICGLNSDPTTNASFKSIDYAIMGEPNGTWSIYESGVKIGNYGTHNDDDVFEIEYAGTQIIYKINGVNKRTKKTTGGRTFYVDSSFDGPTSGSGVFSEVAAIEFGTYSVTNATSTFKAGTLTLTGDERAQVTGNSVTKIRYKSEALTAANWNGQATSSESYIDACVLKFSFGSTTLAAACGINTAPLTKNALTNIDFALVSKADGHIYVYESGVEKADGGAFAVTDIFQIELVGGAVEYTKNGGTPIYTSTTTVTAGTAFYVDSSLYKIGSSITNIQWGQYVTDADAVQAAEEAANAASTTKERAYVCCYVSPLGEEGPPSPPATITVNDLQTVTVEFTADISGEITPSGYSASYNLGSGSKRRIYRTVFGTGDTNYQFVADVDINQTSFDDDLKDVALGEIMPSLDWYPPPVDMQGLIGTPNGFIVGFSGNALCPSELFLPHAFNPNNQLAFPSDITGITTSGSSIVVFTETTPYLVTGTEPDGLSAIQIDHVQTCASRQSIVNMGGYAMFSSPDGLVSVTANEMVLSSLALISRTQWQALGYDSVRAFYYEGMYIGFSDSNAFVFDVRTGEPVFTKLTGFDVVAGYNDVENDTLYTLSSTGNISSWETGSNKTFTWKSKPLYFPSTTTPSCGRIYADGAVTLKVYADDTEVFNQSITNSNVFRLPSGYRAIKFQYELSGSYRVQSIALANSVAELT